MVHQGYARSASYHCVYVKKFINNDFIILLIYVDGMLIIGRDKSKIEKLKRVLSKSFDMNGLGPTRQILRMKISVASMGIICGLHSEGSGKIQHASGQISWFSSRKAFQVEFTVVSLN